MQENSVILQSDVGNDTQWLRFVDPVEVVSCDHPDGVAECLERAEAATRRGYYAAGYIAYEAAGGLDTALKTHAPAGDLPLLWFGVYPRIECFAELPECGAAGSQAFEIGAWTPGPSVGEYAEAVETIRRHIRAGDTYQVNYTFPLRASFSGDAYAFFADRLASQRAAHCAYLDLGDYKICSLSPELYLSVEAQRVVSRPMKGTLARGLHWDEDRLQAEALRRSEKDRAENLMIVDMIRNDLGRVAESGSVQVDKLFEIERYPTVFQMTSTVSMNTNVAVAQLIGHTFPCASITGAPKVKTMEIIRELESAPRGVYTGAIGYMAPRRRARFNVAIRTALIDCRRSCAEYRVGGGIVWDSRPEKEYAECMAKAAVLRRNFPEFELLESLRLDPGRGYWLLEEHLRRLQHAAEYFDFDVAIDEIRRHLQTCATDVQVPRKVRLTVSRARRVTLECGPLETLEGRIVGLANEPGDTRTPFHCHKTTYRSIYTDPVPAGCDEVILWNRKGRLTEAGTANLALATDAGLHTPRREDGLLAGVFREHLLELGVIHEGDISIEDIERGGRLYLLNSVRGWMALEPVSGKAHTWRLREPAKATAVRPDEPVSA